MFSNLPILDDACADKSSNDTRAHLLLNSLIQTNNYEDYNKHISNKIDKLYESKINNMLQTMKQKIMNRYNTLKSRRNIKLQKTMQNNYESCLQAQNKIKYIAANERESNDRNIKIQKEIETVCQLMSLAKQKDNERLMSIMVDSNDVSKAFIGMNVGQFVSEYCQNKYKINDRDEHEKIMNKMQTVFMNIVSNNDATKQVIGIIIRREFSGAQLRCICNNNIEILVELMNEMNMNTYKWIKTKDNEYIGGKHIVGFTDKYHCKKLKKYIYGLMKNNNSMSLHNIYECVNREFVNNYDSWKYCTMENISNIYYMKLEHIESENDDLDTLYFELERNAKMNEIGIDMFKKWIQNNEYDQDSIIDDIITLQNASNILKYFIEKYGDGYKYFDIVKDWCDIVF